MPLPVSLSEAKAFLRVMNDAEDDLVQLLIDAAAARIEQASGLELDQDSPAPLRLAVLMLAAHAFEHRDAAEPALHLVEPWLSSYRAARL